MSTLEIDDDTLSIDTVEVTDARLSVTLADGRIIATPLWWWPRLAKATPAQRAAWQVLPFGDAVGWPEIDEFIGVKGMLRGGPAPGATPPANKDH